MAGHTNASALADVLGRFEQRRPVRAGSLIVTVFGDAIAPRGGSLWLGSLLEIMGLFGIEPGLVRTALSRLVQEDWFERSRSGKSSYYRLSRAGAEKFAEATRRIYHAPEPPWDGTFQMALLTTAKDRNGARDTLAGFGFGQASPTLMLRPATHGLGRAPDCADVVWFASRLEGDAETARQLAATAWPLDELGAAYARFIASFESLLEAEGGELSWGEAQAFRLRILLVHEYRRIILRDPLLPRALLPARWPGADARALCRKLYQLSLPRSERWLDAHAASQGGPLPEPDPALRARFQAE